MRSALCALLLLVIAPRGIAQEGQEGQEEPVAGNVAAEPAWVMPDAERRKIERHLADYIDPGRRTRQDILEKLQKDVSRPVDGHSLLEDVATFTDVAAGLLPANPRAGKKGAVVEIEVRPDVHGFPGGIGTVKYLLYTPSEYKNGERYPLVFCLPDNTAWPEGGDYIQKMWVEADPAIAAGFLVVVPRPQAKGELWTEPLSHARAMISLRHAMGVYGAEEKTAGPAVDARRVFVDGDDAAAVVAARFAEMFAGAVLRGATGKIGKLELVGRLHGLPAYCVADPAKADQMSFARAVAADHEACVVEEAAGGKGDAAALVAWLSERRHAGQPDHLEYFVYDASFQRHHWINVLDFDPAVKPAPSIAARIDRAANKVVLEPHGVSRFELFLNDTLVDLDEKLQVVVVEGEEEMNLFKEEDGKVQVDRSLPFLLEELVASNHPWRIYPVRFIVDVPAVRARHAEEKKS